MKSTWRDFVSAGIFITLLLAASIAIVWCIHPVAASWLGPYHVLAEAALLLLAYGLLSALALRLVLRLRPFPAGEYQPGSADFTQWMLLTVLYRLGQGALNWFLPFYAQHVNDMLFGARVGQGVAFAGKIDDPYRVEVGDYAILGNYSLVAGSYIVGGKMICGPVRIGNNATIGANAVVLPNTTIGDGALLMSGSCLMPGTAVPAGETWRGNPARKWM